MNEAKWTVDSKSLCLISSLSSNFLRRLISTGSEISPSAKAVNFYQASRAATYLGLSPAPPLHPGAQIILDAACPEGLGNGSGEQAFAEALSSVPPPWGQLLGGHAPDKGGVQRALMLARMADRYPIIVAGCDNPAPLISVGVNATSRPAREIAGPDTLVVESPFLRLPQLAYAG